MRNTAALKADERSGLAGIHHRLAVLLAVALMLALPQSRAAEQNLELRVPATTADPTLPALMRDLAVRALPVYQEPDRARYLTNLSALQLVAGDFAAAYATRQSLRELPSGADEARPLQRSVVYDIYAYAKVIQTRDRIPFTEAFTRAFREVVPRLNDRDAYAVTSRLEIPPAVSARALQKLFDQRRAKSQIELPAAIDLIWEYLAFEAHRDFGPLVGALAAVEDDRRYVTDENVLIRTPGGASISAVLVRPKSASKPLPALLEFTIYVFPVNDAMGSAAHGYAGVVAFSRGKRASLGKAVPFEHDGEDARAVINWIAKQPWSDGRVGMYGSDYSGFAAWAAAKHLPLALKAVATSASTAPGIDVPKEGNIYLNSAYPWVRYVTDNKGLDDKIYSDAAYWQARNRAWYISQKPYWGLERIYGRFNSNFRRWLGHPSYDRYWQQMIPYRDDFSRIGIPVLTTTGYYDSAQAGALYYFTQHYQYNPQADQTLLIGPYDHIGIQRGPADELHGYDIDSAALIDIDALRYQWFDYALKGGAKPPLLADRVNYEVMGANEWRHVPSLAAMANGSLKLYLDPASGGAHRLATQSGSNAAFLQQTVNFADRSDAAWSEPSELIRKAVPEHNSMAFASDPLPQSVEVDGLLAGVLDFTPNKMDMDITIALYEQLPGGDYLQLFAPAYEFRASYARDRVHRHLLKAGERQQLAFSSERMMGRRLQAGSRLVMVLGINKRPDQQIDYGTGEDVSDESGDDAKIPLKIRWYNSSYIEIPVRR